MVVDTLVLRAQAGDRQALGELVETYQAQIYSLTLAIVRNPADAADMTQETFVRVLRSIGTYRGDSASFGTWLHRLAVNICIDMLRRKRHMTVSLEIDDTVEVASVDHWDQPEWHAEWRESATEVRAALAELPLPQRIALTLHYFEDSSYEQTAEIMGLPMNTVKSHILRGKQRMARLLAQPVPPTPTRRPQPTFPFTQRGNLRLRFVAA
jgi:RNA polymerase sigma-70 factor (ECF subfamily)